MIKNIPFKGLLGVAIIIGLCYLYNFQVNCTPLVINSKVAKVYNNSFENNQYIKTIDITPIVKALTNASCSHERTNLLSKGSYKFIIDNQKVHFGYAGYMFWTEEDNCYYIIPPEYRERYILFFDDILTNIVIPARMRLILDEEPKDKNPARQNYD